MHGACLALYEYATEIKFCLLLLHSLSAFNYLSVFLFPVLPLNIPGYSNAFSSLICWLLSFVPFSSQFPSSYYQHNFSENQFTNVIVIYIFKALGQSMPWLMGS
jgi:hypothetical protein